MINRLRWRVHELDPAREPKARSLSSAAVGKALAAWLDTPEGHAQVAESSRIANEHDAHVYQVVSVTQADESA